MAEFKYYLVGIDSIDREVLELFMHRFWRDNIWTLKRGELYVKFTIEGTVVKNEPFKYHTGWLIISNNDRSKDLLWDRILCGPIGTALNMHESMYIKECYFSSLGPHKTI